MHIINKYVKLTISVGKGELHGETKCGKINEQGSGRRVETHMRSAWRKETSGESFVEGKHMPLCNGGDGTFVQSRIRYTYSTDWRKQRQFGSEKVTGMTQRY
jgi:hypothetical protein